MSRLIDEIKNMSPEEKAELMEALKPEQPRQESRTLGTSLGNPMHQNQYGQLLSAEELYDREHPITDLWASDYSITESDYSGKTRRRYFTEEEIIAHNKEVKRIWLEEKRKFFPNATLP